ncbi:serine--tRNA ligase [Candidatus Kuenenbacteria bacterium CG23_combo_of_CG06-09_8_20_14_all_36_9]|nr:MAG: serine--tRNA ligase [Candidatus Kuenenbacteria bacterium CG23_combo_of_CG06-09_8_20_14_all_36_9]
MEKGLLKRMEQGSFDLDEIIRLDDQRKELIQKADELKAERNKFSKTKPTMEIIEEMKKVGERIKELDAELLKTEKELRKKLSELPNIPADDVVAGGKENNKVIKTFGKKPEFKFQSKDHIELATKLKLVDYERAVKMSGSGFWCYTGDGALLEWALLNYFVKFHRDNGYEFILPPYLLNEESAYASGHLPKFRGDLFWTNKSALKSEELETETKDLLCLNATAEMMLNNYHRDEILKAEELPKKYFAYSACFRREAGSYRKEERGMVRGHQFNKIEMFQFTKPEDSWVAFDELVKNAEKLVEGLGLHYQTVQLAAGDCSAAMAKTIDIEVWIPSMETYKEVSSVSNALDYQARRANIRYKNDNGKNDFVHTLNGSGLATSRLVPAILEQFQNEDGSVEVPEVLREWVGKKKFSNS